MRAADQTTGQKTGQEDRGPHGEGMTTGRSGRQQPTTAALIPETNRSDDMQQDRLVNQVKLQDEVVPYGAVRSF